VTQSSLADLLRTRGQYDEAERLYRESLRVFEQVPDPLGAAYVLRQLGELALRRGRPQDALPLLEAAHAGFAAIGLDNWLPGVEELLARARRAR
jgi:tetratricopeptide (TPR) repeat protein